MCLTPFQRLRLLTAGIRALEMLHPSYTAPLQSHATGQNSLCYGIWIFLSTHAIIDLAILSVELASLVAMASLDSDASQQLLSNERRRRQTLHASYIASVDLQGWIYRRLLVIVCLWNSTLTTMRHVDSNMQALYAAASQLGPEYA